MRIVSGVMAVYFSEEEWREFVGYRKLITSFFDEDVELESVSFKDFRLSFARVSAGERFAKIMYVRCRTVEVFLSRDNVKALFEEQPVLEYQLERLKNRNFKAYANRVNAGAIRTIDDVLEVLRRDDKEPPVNKLLMLEYYSYYVKQR